ncbi:MAG: hypothetical protein BIP78_1611 [Candidatus Bipolaricaulis sibiricus]|uniref:DUF4282 domain-containing protein n=1 Tax=Bipolaricaulis sibiricus TaxID=2501609 RepID=A0A410FW83_BIPS1|nr:MAG: hypothetical protein BIP78_1611 [Candidatus Bipolaricaulis sibiricus]
MQDYLSFRKMITPVAIQVIFWVGIVACVIVGLVSIVSGASATYGGGTTVLTGILVILLGPLGVRIWCELLIVVFRILDTLGEIRDRLGKG